MFVSHVNKKKNKLFLLTFFVLVFLLFVNPVLAANIDYFSQKEISSLIPVPQIKNIASGVTLNPGDSIVGQSLAFTKNIVLLDNVFLGYTQNEIGTQGWQKWSIDLPQDLSFGQHTFEIFSQHLTGKISESKKINFNCQPKFVSPTLYQPVLNLATNWQQPWVVGLTVNNSIVQVFIDKKLNGQVETANHPSGVTDFKYLPTEKLLPGFHVVQVKAKNINNGLLSDFSNEIVFEIKNGTSNFIAPGLTAEKSEFVPPVPAPTLIEPKNKAVLKNQKFVVSGLVHNEHFVKIYLDDEKIGQFMPEKHSSGVTSFIWQAKKNLSFGSHQLYARAINPRGKISGKSNQINLVCLPLEHFVSQPQGRVASSHSGEAKQQAIDTIIDESEIDKTVDKINSWANFWKWFLWIIIALVFVLIGIWVLNFKTKKEQKNLFNFIKKYKRENKDHSLAQTEKEFEQKEDDSENTPPQQDLGL